jgi:hypothetical protein
MARLPIAVRAYAQRLKKRTARRKASWVQETDWPRDVVVFDTETTTNKTQRLTFGSYRFGRWSEDGTQIECREEGLFYADELPKTDPEGFALLQEYAKSRRAEVVSECPDSILLLSRSEFVEEVLYQLGYKARALIVGFNLPFDLSRLAVDCGAGRGRFRGGFSFVMSRYRDKRTRKLLPNPFQPRIRIRHVDSKRAFIEFNRPKERDEDDQRPTDGAAPNRSYSPPGRFLDLRTLTFALTSRGHSLASACEAFDVAHPKAKAEQHGVITTEYIDYNRRDVLASQELLEKLRVEFDRHPIELDPCKAYSAASIAKSYFRAMGLRPAAEQFKRLSRKRLGQAMSAFYGGRAEVRIRKAPVPVVHTDFLSMYPTVQSLMKLWGVLSAEKLEFVNSKREFQELLDRVSVEDVFRPELWPNLLGFAQVIPDGDVLPVRARYQGSEWNVGVNPLTSQEPLWYAIPDLVAAKLLTGKAPRIVKAFRIIPEEMQNELRSIRLGGAVKVDPRKENLFKTVIEERKRVQKDERLPIEERNRIQQFLKIFANAGSYGVFVEMNRNELPSGKAETLSIFGRDGEFESKTNAPEEPGAYCFPPVASLITAGARLMLALLERVVTDQGGTYVFADTDSMAIVANESGGFVPCEGGPHRLPDGREAIRALSWEAVESIVNRFETLNPYDPKAVPRSILKIEDVNFARETKRQIPIHCFAISAKRYAFFTIDSEGHPEVIEGGYSEHGLGQYLNPIDPNSEDTNWIRAVWQGIIEEAFGGAQFEPEWIDRPAVMRSSVSTPGLLKRFDRINRKKSYAKQVKPFNFLLSASVDSIEWPPKARERGRFHLIAPYSRNPLEWLRIFWADLHSNDRYRIRSKGHSNPASIRVRTFRDALDRFREHPEAKSADRDGKPSGKKTIGLLRRLPVELLCIFHIGKEANLIEQQEEGILLTDPQAVYLGGGEWEAIRKWLDRVPTSELSKRSGVDARRLREYRQGVSRPRPERAKAIAEALARMLRFPAV